MSSQLADRSPVWRGPLVDRFEGIDNPEVDDLRDLTLRDDTAFETAHDQPMLGGITKLQCAATNASPTRLYRPVASADGTTQPVTADRDPVLRMGKPGAQPHDDLVDRDHTRSTNTRAFARFAIGGFAGAVLIVLGFAPSAFAAPVSHFAINSVGLTEGNAGTTNLTFTISYTGTKNNISVDWATADGTATAPADYTASSGTATFTLAGAMSQTINVPVAGDLLDEANNETFTVNLTNPQLPAIADITTATGTRTITDDDPTPSIVINDVSLTEGNSGTTNADFAVTLSAPSGRNVTVNYTTANSTAIQPGDYTTAAGTLTFTPGQVLKTIHFRSSATPTTRTTTYFINLSGATNATIADTQGLGTIVNDDAPPSIAINDVSLTEGNAGTATLTFTATLSVASGKTVTVAYATADGTATAPADYTAASGTVTFTAGQRSRPVVDRGQGRHARRVRRDVRGEPLSPTNASIADSQGVGAIPTTTPPPHSRSTT